MLVRTQQEIEELLSDAVEAECNGESQFPGMTYEQGVSETLRWLLDRSVPSPLAP
jgi:hypothetical protein